MRLPSRFVQLVNVFIALPVGWLLGVFLAMLIAGREFGQLPILTVPTGLVMATAFAVWPSVKVETRFAVLLASLLVLSLLSRLI